jgi:hypothetical protein
VGDYCLATFNGEKWYRAEVVEEVSSASSSIKYEVVYIDFENRAILDVGDLAIMPPALEQYPAQAVKACLAGVRRVPPKQRNVTAVGRVWDLASYDFHLLLQFGAG